MVRNINDRRRGKIEALKHAIAICDSKNLKFKSPAYRCACEEIKVCLEASVERLMSGDEMNSTCSVQGVAFSTGANDETPDGLWREKNHPEEEL